MPKTYLIDVLVRGQPPGVTEGDEPIIAATRVGVQVPDVMTNEEAAQAIGEQIQKVGSHFLASTDQLGVSIDRYDEAMEEETDFSDVPPELRPN